MKARILAALVAASVACTASASGPLVVCISGCPAKAGTLKDTLIGDQWWVGPSVGLALFARDSSTKAWSSQIAFNLAYSLEFKPTWWTVTPSFFSVDLGLAAGGQFTNNGTPFTILLAPTITLLDFLRIGYGFQVALSNAQGVPDKVSGVLFLGLGTSFGGP